MNLIIDIGNTHAKVAVFSKNEVQVVKRCDRNELLDQIRLLEENYPIEHAILSTVGGISEKEISQLNTKFPVLVLDSQTPVPFKNRYGTPETLGVDRIALMTAAVTEFPDKQVLVIDAGSSITYDFITADKLYFGGAISPGIKMRYKSLNAFTANLPLLSPADRIPAKGDSTQNAVHSGVLNGVICEIEGIIGQYRQKNKKLTVVLTGGDANFLAKNIKSTIFAIPNFLLVGLNRILIYNIDE